MRENGYAAVTSRALAARAGLKAQLVHYYFRTMDDLFLALFQRVASALFARQTQILESEQPLQALWDLTSDPKGVVLGYEFVALANHRKAIRAQIAEFGDRFREGHVKIVARILKERSESKRGTRAALPPIVYAVLLDSVARVLSLESALGMSVGHAQTLAAIQRFIRNA